MAKTLIHTALLCEAQPLINYLKLQENKSFENIPLNSKIFLNNDYVLIVSGIGKINTQNSLNFIFENFEIKKAINIGIAGCCESSVKIGTLFCTNKLLKNINFASITTVDEPLESDENLETLLVDMESKYFLEICKKNLDEIYCFKIVSDYLDTQIPKKSFVIELIEKSKSKWKNYL